MSTNYNGVIPESLVKLPLNSYKLQVLEAEMKSSAKGSPMCVVTLEFVDNPTFLQDDVEVNPNGISFQHFMVLGDKNLGYGNSFNAFLKAIGLPPVQNAAAAQVYDVGVFSGKVLGATCKTEERQQTKPGTKEGITHPITGKPVMTYDKRVQQFLSL